MTLDEAKLEQGPNGAFLYRLAGLFAALGLAAAA
jgi:hypothetical protein